MSEAELDITAGGLNDAIQLIEENLTADERQNHVPVLNINRNDLLEIIFDFDLENATEEVAELIISNSHASQVSTFVLKITQGSTARVIRWDGSGIIKWPGGTEPTLTTTNNAVDVFQFTTWDTGTSWYGKVVGQNMNHEIDP